MDKKNGLLNNGSEGLDYPSRLPVWKSGYLR